jgi:tripartite-type tricarboxylate transporter receptor subunit TctC
VSTLFAAAMRVLALGALIVSAAAATAQQPYPSKPIRLIVPFPPGGSNNAVARIVGQKLTESWGQPVTIDNRPGGNTVIGTEALVKSPPDGYTLLLNASSHVTTPLMQPTPYDVFKDFAPIAAVAATELVLVIHPSVPANNLKEFIALARAKPGEINFGSAGTGNATHLAGELFNMLTGAKMQHVPYKGGGPAITDLIGGQIQLYIVSPASALPAIKSGRIKPIAISGEARSPALPQVPTFTEGGLPGFDVKAWSGIFAPAGTPKEIVDQLSGEIAAMVALPDTKEKLGAQGLEPFYAPPDRFAAIIKADSARYARIIKTANIKLDQ